MLQKRVEKTAVFYKDLQVLNSTSKNNNIFVERDWNARIEKKPIKGLIGIKGQTTE